MQETLRRLQVMKSGLGDSKKNGKPLKGFKKEITDTFYFVKMFLIALWRKNWRTPRKRSRQEKRVN